uniref:Uncharacterized protein n=1 Tax=Opuntia streptacantha TaxID=393608 RepID=A0A7C9DZ09_OPUST
MHYVKTTSVKCGIQQGTNFQGRLAGFLSETTWMTLPSTEMALSPTGFTSASKVPRVESYLRRWEACLTPPVSLMTTTSRGDSFLPCQHLRKFLPILPNPLIATLSCALTTPFCPRLLLPTALVWKATKVMKSSEPLRAKGSDADEQLRPEHSANGALLETRRDGLAMESTLEAMLSQQEKPTQTEHNVKWD